MAQGGAVPAFPSFLSRGRAILPITCCSPTPPRWCTRVPARPFCDKPSGSEAPDRCDSIGRQYPHHGREASAALPESQPPFWSRVFVEYTPNAASAVISLMLGTGLSDLEEG